MDKTTKDVLDGEQGNRTEVAINTTSHPSPLGMTSEMTKKEDGTSMERGGEKMNTEACRNSSDRMGVPVERYNLHRRKNTPETNQPQASQVVEKGTYPCPTCGKEFACPEAMHGHMWIHSKRKDVKDNKEEVSPVVEDETNNKEEEEEEEEEEEPSEDGDAGAAFSKGEKVFAFHGSRMYEAKVKEVEFGKKEWRYFIHYVGWKKSWDEWVGADRLLKYTDESFQKQNALGTQKAGETRTIVKSERSSHRKAKALSGKQTKGQPGTKEKVTTSPAVEKTVPIQLSSILRKQLVSDWELVTQLGKLVKLPRSPNVDDMLKKYLDYRTRKDGKVAAESVGEILKGLRCYFDKVLPAMLLYGKERQQFHEAVKDGASPSAVYGAEHLLRLFVKLPELLACVDMEEEALAKLQQNLLNFLKFLQKHRSTFFLSAYDG